MRQVSRQSFTPSEEPHTRTVLKYLNILNSKDPSSENYWKVIVKHELQEKFPKLLHSHEAEDSFDIRVILII